MGVWGHSPWDSDDYGDMTDAIRSAYSSAVLPKIEAALARAERSDTAEKWAAIGIVIVAYQSTYLDRDSCWDLVQRAKMLWNQCREDSAWIRSWRHPKVFKRTFDAVGQELDDMSDYKQEARIVELMFEGKKR